MDKNQTQITKSDTYDFGCIGCVVWIVGLAFIWWLFFDNGWSHVINLFNKIGS